MEQTNKAATASKLPPPPIYRLDAAHAPFQRAPAAVRGSQTYAHTHAPSSTSTSTSTVSPYGLLHHLPFPPAHALVSPPTPLSPHPSQVMTMTHLHPHPHSHPHPHPYFVHPNMHQPQYMQPNRNQNGHMSLKRKTPYHYGPTSQNIDGMQQASSGTEGMYPKHGNRKGTEKKGFSLINEATQQPKEGYSKEEIDQWIADRKRQWPSKKRVEEKQAHQGQNAKGATTVHHRDATGKIRGRSRGRERDRGVVGRGRGRGRGRGSGKDGGKASRDGYSNLNIRDHPPSTADSSIQGNAQTQLDEETANPNTQVPGALGMIACGYASSSSSDSSSSEEGSGCPDELALLHEIVVEQSKPSDYSLLSPPKPKDHVQNSNLRPQQQKNKRKQHQIHHKQPYRRSNLLHSLLDRDAQKTRTAILQVFQHLVKNSFFQQR